MTTKEKILLAAREQIQHKGYNGFSYADLAIAVGIRKASIHHHFPTKAMLAEEVAAKYRHDFMAALQVIETGRTTRIKQLESYIHLFRKTLEEDRKVCLCIMLASNSETLPDAVRMEVRTFFQDNEAWLTRLLTKGQKEGDFELKSEASQISKSIISALEGAMVIAESVGDPSRLLAITHWILSSLEKEAG